MALIKCYECGGKVSTAAKACPHCGAPIEVARKKRKKTEDEIYEEFMTDSIRLYNQIEENLRKISRPISNEFY